MQLDDSLLSKLCTFIRDQIKIPEISLFNRIKLKNKNLVGRSCKRVGRTANYAVIVETHNENILVLIGYFVYIQQSMILLFVGKELIQKQSWSILPCWNQSQVMKIEKEE